MFRLYLITIFLIVSASTAFSQPVENQLSKVNTVAGLHTTDFKTKSGVLTIYLPSDLTVTETASGTVSFKKNKTEAQGVSGLNEFLTNYKLIIENRPVEFTGDMFLIQIPINLPTGVLGVSLQDSQGRVVNRAFFPVRLTKRGNLPPQVGKANFRLPVTSRSGQPASVSGNFDGNLSNASVSISGTPAKVLAESKKQLVFLTPSNLQGAKVLTFREGDVEVKNPFTVLYVVKVGEPQPEIYADTKEYGIKADSPRSEVLIESENQTGEIDLNAMNELNPAKQFPNASPTPQLQSNEEIALGPTTGNLSKPLELNPNELQQLRKSKSRVISNEDLIELNELKELDTFQPAPESLKTPVKAEPKKNVIAKNKVSPGSKDISEIQTTIYEQLTAQFIPLESKTSPSATELKEPEKNAAPEPAVTVKEKPVSKPEPAPKVSKNKKTDEKTTVAKSDKKEPEKPKDIVVTEKIEILEQEKLEETPDIVGPKLPEQKIQITTKSEKTETPDKTTEAKKDLKPESQKKQLKKEVAKEKPVQDVKGTEKKEVVKKEKAVDKKKDVKEEAKKTTAKKEELKKPTELTVTEKIEITEDIKSETASDLVGPKPPENLVIPVKKTETKADKKEQTKPKEVKVVKKTEVEEVKVDLVGPMLPAGGVPAVNKTEPKKVKAEPKKEQVKKKTDKDKPAKVVKKPESKKAEKKEQTADKKKVAKKEPEKKQAVKKKPPKEVKKPETKKVKKKEKPAADKKKVAKKEVKKEQKKPEKKPDKKKADKKEQTKPKETKVAKKTEVEEVKMELVGPVLPEGGVQTSKKTTKVKKKKKAKKTETVKQKPAKTKVVKTAKVEERAGKKPTAESSGAFAIQFASFKKQSEAADLVSRMQSGGYDVYYKKFKVPGKGYWYRVRKGGFGSREEAENFKSGLNLSQFGISSFFVTPEDI